MKLTRLEQETIINFNAEENTATLYTSYPAVYRRMIKKGYEAERLDECSWLFTIPKRKASLPRKLK